MKIKKIPKTDLEYVEIYAENLKSNPNLFRQQKILIDSQMKASQSFFRNLFGEENFNSNAREYLKERGLI